MRILIVAFLMACLSACGGGSSDDDAGLASATDVSGAIAAATHAQAMAFSGELAMLQAKQAADEKLISRMELFGHVPGATVSTDAVRTLAMQGEPVIQPQATGAIGPCPDMGQLVGYNSPDPLEATVAYFKQCTGIEYGVNIEDNSIASPAFVWFTDDDCGASGGQMIVFENDASYTRQALQDRVAFNSPANGAEMVVDVNQTGTTMTSGSIYTGGSCNPDVETHTGYVMAPNVTSVTGVPTVAPAGWIL